jgi:hypothetical protein
LRYARKGKLVNALQSLQKAYDVMQSSSVSVECSLIAESFTESVWAYLDYRNGEIISAKNRIDNALSIDIRLEKEFGYHILALHRVQLVHNLMRIEKYSNNYIRVFQYGNALLEYLEGKSSAWPLSKHKGDINISLLPITLVEKMFIQIAGELSMIMTSNRLVEDRLFSFIQEHADSINNSSCKLYWIPHEWIRTKKAFLANSLINFLTNAIVILSYGPEKLSLLWRSTVLDLFYICNQIDSPSANRIKNEIIKCNHF